MSTWSNRTNCKPAQLCYYDLLDAEAAGTVAEAVHEHVAFCKDCQADINRLKGLLASAGKKTDNEKRLKDSAVIELLSLHFAWVDKLVTCREARPFLPSLADPLLKITIPTPITAHLDNCRACSQEMLAIKDAGLTHTQLCHLSRALAEHPDEDADSLEVRAAFPPVAAMIERPVSGVVTRFTVREPAELGSSELYEDQPIEVEVINRQEPADANQAKTSPNYGSSEYRQPALIRNLKRHMRPAIAAAAVIFVGLALFFTTPTVSAVNLDLIYRALERASNIHVTHFIPGTTEPEREKWVSRPLSMYVSKVGQELTLWDLRAGSQRVKGSHDVALRAVPFTEAEAAATRRIIDSPLGIVPFNKVSDVPRSAKWNRVTDDVSESGTQDSEVYELTWTASTDRGEPRLRKWRVFVELKTNLPKKARFSDKSPTDTEYVLRNELLVEYLSDQKVEAAIREASL